LNGVVVVTTKQGRRESPLNISYSLEQTARVVPNYNQYILNSQETMSVLKKLNKRVPFYLLPLRVVMEVYIIFLSNAQTPMLLVALLELEMTN
jgi:hypothetical protein